MHHLAAVWMMRRDQIKQAIEVVLEQSSYAGQALGSASGGPFLIQGVVMRLAADVNAGLEDCVVVGKGV
jgi:hypothetical protein